MIRGFFCLFLLFPIVCKAQDIIKEYDTPMGIIKAKDSIKLNDRPPYVYVYPRPNVDVALRGRYLYSLEHKLLGATLPIIRIERIGTKKTKRTVAIIKSKSASSFVEVEYYVEIDKALESKEIEIIKR